MPSGFFSAPFFGAPYWGAGVFSGLGAAGLPTSPILEVDDLANGGGGLATITGSNGGATNTLYSQTYDPAFTLRPWRALGDRVGDGVLSFALPLGHYGFYVLSETDSGQAVSNLTYGAITDAARQSVQYKCLQATAVRIKALALPGLAAQSVLVQELPWSRLFEGDNPRLPLPGIIVCLTGSERRAIASNRRDDVGYPCLISILARNNQELRTYLPRYTLWREMIARAFSAGKLPGVQEVISMTVEPGTIVVPDPFLRQIWHSALVVRCTSREPRGLGA